MVKRSILCDEVAVGRCRRARMLCGVLAMITVGCGGDGRVPADGTVTWNGEPVEAGYIVFTPVDPTVTPEATQIHQGAFTLRLLPGDKRVEIFADRAVGEPDPTMHIQRKEQYIPRRYNEETELTAQIRADSENQLQFNLAEQKGDRAAGSF